MRRILIKPAVLGALALVLTGALVAVAATAFAATLFSDDFADGNATGWSTSGGTWSVTTVDGSPAYQQSGTSADARARAGQSSSTNYTAAARVRPTAFNGANRFVALLARAQSTNSYYY